VEIFQDRDIEQERGVAITEEITQKTKGSLVIQSVPGEICHIYEELSLG
jgi:hypothetical protein